MDSKRPDVRLDDTSEGDGYVTTRESDGESSRSLLETIRAYLRR